jgi:hypothetical protein
MNYNHPIGIVVYRRGHSPGTSAGKRNGEGQTCVKPGTYGNATQYVTLEGGAQQKRAALEALADAFGRLAGMFAIRASIRHCLISPSVESELIAELKQEPGALGNMAQLVLMTLRAYAVKQYNDNPMWRDELWQLYGLPAARRYFRMYHKQIEPIKRERAPLWIIEIDDTNRKHWE